MGSLSKISRINNVKLPTDLVIINSAPTPSSTAEKESIFEILRVSFRSVGIVYTVYVTWYILYMHSLCIQFIDL